MLFIRNEGSKSAHLSGAGASAELNILELPRGTVNKLKKYLSENTIEKIR
jgi:hypothetical protein